MTQVEILSPCCLHVGFVWVDGVLCELGIALQRPFVQMSAWPSETLTASGPRAELALTQAEQSLAQHAPYTQMRLEIEEAIPAWMGLGSDGVMQASIETALVELGMVEIRRVAASLQDHAAAQGGLLLVGADGALLQRSDLPSSEDDAWAFVLVLPNADQELPDSFEADQARVLQAACVHLNPNTQDAMQALWQAAQHSNFAAFATALAHIHTANEDALAHAGSPRIPSTQEHEMFKLMRDNGVQHCGRALTGLGLYALVQGREACRTLRNALTQHFGYFGPSVITTICDNEGTKIKLDG